MLMSVLFCMHMSVLCGAMCVCVYMCFGEHPSYFVHYNYH